jgi:phospholipid/cholesterol/gamma-HCH transport system ATP-binding protein
MRQSCGLLLPALLPQAGVKELPLLQAQRSPVAQTDDVLVSIQDVTFGYDSRVVLSRVSLDFARGKLIAIMGSSGCGKTTLLRLIGGVVTPQSGRILFSGATVDTADRAALYALRRRMGMLFQFGALFTDLSVFDNVAFPLREHTTLGEAMIRDIVLMKLDSVGLRGAAALGIAQISGGMARRVALARAVALDPEIIMYDEPFTGLDPISLGVTANLIRRLNDATGATSLIVSHDVEECFQICDYAYLMSAGRVIAHGTPAQLNASEEPEVRQFIRGEPDGPVKFHYPAAPIAQEMGISP